MVFDQFKVKYEPKSEKIEQVSIEFWTIDRRGT